MAEKSQQNLPKIRKLSNLDQRHFYWALRTLDKFSNILKTLEEPSHPTIQKINSLKNLNEKLDKDWFLRSLPEITQSADYIPNEEISTIIKKDIQKVNPKYNELVFLTKSNALLQKTEHAQNIDSMKEDIQGKVERFYNDGKLAHRLSRLSEKKLIAEADFLRGFYQEVRAGNVQKERVERIRNDFSNKKLADDIEKLREDIPRDYALPNLRSIANSIAPNGSNLIEVIGRYSANPQLIIDRKTQIKFTECIEKTYAYLYFEAVGKKIAGEFRGADRGRWELFKILSDMKSLTAWINRLSNGYSLNRGDLIIFGLPQNNLLLGKRIKDKEIANLLANLRHKTIDVWDNVLRRFISVRLSRLAQELLVFISQRIKEIPLERQRALSQIMMLIEKRISFLKKRELILKRKINSVIHKRVRDHKLYLGGMRIKWHYHTKKKLDEVKTNFDTLRDTLKRELESCYEIISAYPLRFVTEWESGGNAEINLTESEEIFINLVYSLTEIYKYWFKREGLQGNVERVYNARKLANKVSGFERFKDVNEGLR